MSKGIEDMDQKVEALRELLPSRNRSVLCEKLAEITPPLERNHISGKIMASSAKDWRKVNGSGNDPTGPAGQAFLKCVAYLLKSKGSSASQERLEEVIWHGSIDDFIDLIPADHLTDRIDEMRRRSPRYEDLSQILSGRQFGEQDFRSGVKRGRLDQKICYFLPDAANAWESIVRGGHYGQYGACKSALERLTNRDEWKEFCERGPAGFVALGGGSASKDILVMSSMARLTPPDRRKMRYYLVDFSTVMLERTDADIQTLAQDALWVQRFHHVPELRHLDFLDMSRKAFERRADQPLGWGIFGGTIGNLDEAAFLASIAGLSHTGDLLLVSMETIPQGMTAQQRIAFAQKLEETYTQRKIKELLRGSLALAWPYMRQNRSFEDAVTDIRAEVVEGRVRGHSAVDESLTVEMFTEWNGERIVIAPSTRYVEDGFKAFARNHCFEHQFSVESPSDPNFKILAFRRS